MKPRWVSIPAATMMMLSGGQAQADEALARKTGCFECHGAVRKVTGPTFDDIAAKYKGDARAREALIETVKRGGKGNWTSFSAGVPMPPYSPRLSDADIEHLVDWVLAR